MSDLDYLRQIERDGQRFADALRDGPLDAAVAACPGWTLRDLAGHIGWVQRWATAVVQSGGPIDQTKLPDLAPGEDAVEYFASGCAALVGTLAAAELDAPTWHLWRNEKVVGAWLRRQCHELALHRWDAEAAVGLAPGFDAALASDGIDEYFDIIIPRKIDRDGNSLPTGSLHVHCTDVHGEWMIRVDHDSYVVTREHAKGDVAWRGPAVELLLVLWGRAERSDAQQVFGDQALLDAWLALGGS